MKSTHHIARTWGTARRAVAQRLFLDRQAAFWIGELAPLRARHGLRAQVVSVVEETEDTKSFVLRPSVAWRGHRAGQYLSVEVEVDGVRMHRCYSISSAPSQTDVVITVKRLPGGRVSRWLHEQVGPGDILEIGPAVGDFVLAETPPARLLLLSGGSGITPVMSILRDLDERDAVHDVVFVHHAREKSSVVFRDELETLANRHAGLRVYLCTDDDPTAPRGFDEAQFMRLVPDFAEREAFLCGPEPLMARAELLWEGLGASERLHRERFATAPMQARTSASSQEVRIRLARSNLEVTTKGAGTLLEQLERAGQHPPHACRMGICHTCSCRKLSGAVRNTLTGEVSSEPDEAIRLCISVPESNLELEL